jgi:hypothetical protein
VFVLRHAQYCCRGALLVVVVGGGGGCRRYVDATFVISHVRKLSFLNEAPTNGDEWLEGKLACLVPR